MGSFFYFIYTAIEEWISLFGHWRTFHNESNKSFQNQQDIESDFPCRDSIKCYLSIRHLSKISEWKMRTEFFPSWHHIMLFQRYLHTLSSCHVSRVPGPTRIVDVVTGPQFRPWSMVNNTYRNRNWATEQQLPEYQWQIRAWLIAWLRNKPEPKKKRPCQPLPPPHCPSRLRSASEYPAPCCPDSAARAIKMQNYN